jgi:hypothetical protein
MTESDVCASHIDVSSAFLSHYVGNRLAGKGGAR